MEVIESFQVVHKFEGTEFHVVNMKRKLNNDNKFGKHEFN